MPQIGWSHDCEERILRVLQHLFWGFTSNHIHASTDPVETSNMPECCSILHLFAKFLVIPPWLSGHLG